MLKLDILHSLKQQLPPGQVFTDTASLISYEVDAGLDKGVPEAIVFPRTASELSRIVRWAVQHHIPLIARGAGTGLSGGAVADRGGIIVEFARMNSLLELDTHGRSAVVEPGLINLRLDEQAKAHGLYFPPDPASQRASTIGGNVSENSGGPHCFKYGVTTNYISGLDVVLADRQTIRVGGRALDYPEYDFCGLITGSEGMLALITAITVRLQRNPPGIKTMLAVFESIEQAGNAVSAIIAAGLVPATMEMMDQKIIWMIEEFVHIGLPTDAGAIIIIEVDGYPASLDAQANEIVSILQAQGVRNVQVAQSDEERQAIWYGRKSAAGAITRLTPSYYTVDITVPRSCLAETLAEVNQICERYQLRNGYLLHAGDGNLHPMLMIPEPGNPQLMQRIHHAGAEMVKLCVSYNGSLTGEHGVGIEKREFMSIMHTPAELAAMWDIKEVFDPDNILNPGKVFPSNIAAIVAHVRASITTAFNTAHNPHLQNNIFTPASAEEAAQGLVALGKLQRHVSITGSPQDMDNTQADVILSTSALSGIRHYAPDDLYITVGAGTLIAEIQAFLAEHGKMLPLVAPEPASTIGGLIATNRNAPQRMRYGAIRDNVLCATVVLPDGRIIRAGRPVVKNVAGYDLMRLFVGSYGTLGLLTDVTLKIVSCPRLQRTLLIPVTDLQQGLALAEQLLPLALVCSALLLCKNYAIAEAPATPYTLVYTAEGLVEDVETELAQVRQILQQYNVTAAVKVGSESGTSIWQRYLQTTVNQLTLRIGVAPKDLSNYLQEQANILNSNPFIADISSGLIYTSSAERDGERAKNWLEELRQPALSRQGYAIATSLPADLRGQIDPWGYTPQSLALMKKLKAQWDPYHVLN